MFTKRFSLSCFKNYVEEQLLTNLTYVVRAQGSPKSCLFVSSSLILCTASVVEDSNFIGPRNLIQKNILTIGDVGRT